MKSLTEIITTRKESSCACTRCADMCKRSPCFGTPQEMEAIRKAGYSDKLAATIFVDVASTELYAVVAPKQIKGGCVFLENGYCALHDKGLKPIEGRLAHHALGDDGLRPAVCDEWIGSELGQTMVLEYDDSLKKVLYNKLIDDSIEKLCK